MRKDYIDFGPVHDAFAARGGLYAVIPDGDLYDDKRQNTTLGVALVRAIPRGTATVWLVDELCVKYLHKHPMELYGNDWLNPENTTATPRIKEELAA